MEPDLVTFTDEQRLEILNWLIFKQSNDYSLDDVIQELQLPLGLDA